MLRRVGDQLVEIHGQFDTHGLLDSSTHRGLLDEYAGLNVDLPSAWKDWKAREEALQALSRSANTVLLKKTKHF